MNLVIVGSTPQLGQWDPTRGLQMRYYPDGIWKADLRLSEQEVSSFDYRYAIHDRDTGRIEYEGGESRRFTPSGFQNGAIVEQRDFWRPPLDPENIFASAPFHKVIFRRSEADQDQDAGGHSTLKGIHMRLLVPAPRVAPEQSLYVTGNIPGIGLWNPQKALPLHGRRYPAWQVDFHISPMQGPLEYKYFIADREKSNIAWESGNNRKLTGLDSFGDPRYDDIVVSDYPFRSPGPAWKGAGLAVPVFSLRTKEGLGVGEFPDLKLLADWAKQAGLQMIQILPVNDTMVHLNRTDSYPYSLLSVFALHPLYLNLQGISGISTEMKREIDATAKQMNEKSGVDYDAVISAKMGFLKRIFTAQAADFLVFEAFQVFFRDHAEWLRPYAAFCYLRDYHHTSDYRKWGVFSRGSQAIIDQLTDPDAPQAREIAFYYFIQFHLHHQLMEASRYARDCGVVLKGDIPIGVDKMSVETWLHPEWFRMDKSAGAPPDDFAVEGQNWGFPTYDWEAMAADGYIWWKQRLIHLSRYFAATRLDHVIGFFRIWEIPGDAVIALKGRFRPAIPLSGSELEEAGIKDMDTLCEPYITTGILADVFGRQAEEVIRKYFAPSGTDRYRFRAEFDSQNKIAACFFSHPFDIERSDNERHEQLKGLFHLYDDVILIPDQERRGRFFHPRIAMERTRAFQALDKVSQGILSRFYRDYYFRRQESLWEEAASVRLSVLKSATDMMLCGEDLGMVPNCVSKVMGDLGILSLRIQRMANDPGAGFGDPADYPYLSVASPSSHDMSTIRGWWEEQDRALIQSYYNGVLKHPGAAPKTCEPWICREIIDLHLKSGSIWAVFPIQDILAMSADLRRPNPYEEQINEPSSTQHHWTFRIHVPLEHLISQRDFNMGIRKMILSEHRGCITEQE